MNVIQRLQAMFGDNVMQKLAPIGAEYNSLLEKEVTIARMPIDNGRIFVHCGMSKTLFYFSFEEQSMRGNWSVVYDEEDAKQWDEKNRKNDWNGVVTSNQIGPRPSEMLRLVWSS